MKIAVKAGSILTIRDKNSFYFIFVNRKLTMTVTFHIKISLLITLFLYHQKSLIQFIDCS